MLDHLSLSLSGDTFTRELHGRTETKGREGGRATTTTTAKTRYQATHVTVSIAHYLRSIEQTATLLPLVSRLHAHRPPPSSSSSRVNAPARAPAAPVLLSRLCSETMNKRREERSPARSTFLNKKRRV